MFYENPDSCQIPRLDMIYEDIFGQKHFGNFIDVGSFDSIHTSNTFALAKLGWNGAMIEPVEAHFRQSVHNIEKHNLVNTKAYNYAVYCESGLARKIQVNGTISSMSKEQMNAFKQFDWSKDRFSNTLEIQEVTTISLNDFITKHFPYIPLDVLSIDVEGLETAVIQNFDFDKHRPKIVIIETCGLHSCYDNFPNLRMNMKFVNNCMKNACQGKYELYFKDYINSVWVLKD